jgi:hypothetical protein
LIKIMITSFAVVMATLVAAIALLHSQTQLAVPLPTANLNANVALPAEAVTPTASDEAKPNLTAPPTTTTIEVNSKEQAALADALADDDRVKVQSSVPQPTMVRVANNWLVPQLETLTRQVTRLRATVTKDRQYLSENAPRLVPLQTKVTQLQQDYRHISRNLDLPSLPNSDYSDHLDARYLEIKTELEKYRRELNVLEKEVDIVTTRVNKDEPMLTQLEVELANMQERLSKVRQGEYRMLATTYQYAVAGLATLPLLRFLGRGSWSVQYVNEVTTAFEKRFGRQLPVSALGQSNTHNRLGWDHREAVDVAVHPGSIEGQWLMGYLREREVPFLAFRGAVPGIATGPHLHIGLPSRRLRQ